ncbi:hypothetical protein [Sphaerotilus uruguayifluvii]|uniref:RES domain-containing protein n=1 Tax=Sphaerotilus uruguayifluvii TaxID=2735897 RepID=A0ABX2G7W3_9BURK|nr:hypothetical protein [Leptothrix sp. C29]NRT58428.1 hypothetical protein [Leptothrix sp. C29]
MIFVVEVPEAGPAQSRAWFAYGELDFLRKVCAGDALPEWEVFDVATPRELLDLADRVPESPDARQACPAVCGLADAHGWDTPLYRADHLLGAGHFQAQAVSPLQAGLAALQARGGQWRVYGSEDVAMAAVDAADALFDAPGGWRARHALREQLIATEALADDH